MLAPCSCCMRSQRPSMSLGMVFKRHCRTFAIQRLFCHDSIVERTRRENASVADRTPEESGTSVECTCRLPITLNNSTLPISNALGKQCVRQVYSTRQRCVCRVHSIREWCVCRVHSTSNALVECTRQAMRLSSALAKQCGEIKQIPDLQFAFGVGAGWSTSRSTSYH